MKSKSIREYKCHIVHRRPGVDKLYTDIEWYAAASRDELRVAILRQYALWGFPVVAFKTSDECSVFPCHTK